jgi:hypothetical protein
MTQDTETFTERQNRRAAILADEGRRQCFPQSEAPSREERGKNMIRAAFWRIHDKNSTQVGREQSDEGLQVEIYETMMNATRADERQRLAAIAVSALTTLVGEEAAYDVISELADAVGIERGFDW